MAAIGIWRAIQRYGWNWNQTALSGMGAGYAMVCCAL
jgi:hypothetical protein